MGDERSTKPGSWSNLHAIAGFLLFFFASRRLVDFPFHFNGKRKFLLIYEEHQLLADDLLDRSCLIRISFFSFFLDENLISALLAIN